MNSTNKKAHFQELGQTAFVFVLLGYFFQEFISVWLISCIGLVVVLLGLIVWQFRFYNHFLWKIINRITQIVGEFLLLFFVYFLLVTPIGVLFKLKRRGEGDDNSSLVDSTDDFVVDNLDKTW